MLARPSLSVRISFGETGTGGGRGTLDERRELGRQTARTRLTRYRSVSGNPATSIKSPHCGAFSPESSMLDISPSGRWRMRCVLPQTAMTHPDSLRRPRRGMREGDSRRRLPSSGTSNGSELAVFRTLMSSIPRMWSVRPICRRLLYTTGLHTPVTIISAPTRSLCSSPCGLWNAQ